MGGKTSIRTPFPGVAPRIRHAMLEDSKHCAFQGDNKDRGCNNALRQTEERCRRSNLQARPRCGVRGYPRKCNEPTCIRRSETAGSRMRRLCALFTWVISLRVMSLLGER